jgi:DnaJ-class molecular chaperone
MSPLIVIPCPTCGGDAYLEDERGAERCVTCDGLGQVEVCEGCNEIPTVVAGYEVCGCAVVELSRAA